MVTLEFAHVAWLVGGSGGLFAMLGKLLLVQFEKRLDDRFSGLNKQLSENSAEWDRIDKELVNLRLRMSEDYARKDDVKAIRDQIEKGFEKLYEKLDAKVSRQEFEQYKENHK